MKCNQDDKKIESCHKDKKSAVQKFPLAFGNTGEIRYFINAAGPGDF